MAQIAARARKALADRLADQTIGYQARIIAALANYPGLEHKIVQIPDFSRTSRHFIQGNIPPQLLDQSTAHDYPCMTLCTLRAQNFNSPVGAIFGGQMEALIMVYLSFENSEVLNDYESYADCVEDAMFTMMNDADHLPLAPWVQYSGRMTCTRNIVVSGGENWLAALAFNIQLSLEVIS